MNETSFQILAERAGIERGYVDTWGHQHLVDHAITAAILRAMGFAPDDDAAIANALRQLDARPAPAAVADGSAWQPDAFVAGGRRWGVAVQLYALRSPRNWGIGDFTDLIALVRGAATLGAAAVGVNPLHALFPGRPEHASPYSPSSRHFINPLYLDVEAIPGFARCARAQARARSPRFQQRLAAARAAGCIDYNAVAELKWPVFAGLYRDFRRRCAVRPDDPQVRAFQDFQREEGAGLARFARFNAIAMTRGEIDWRRWPFGLHDPASSAVAAFAQRHAAAVEFHAWLQWQASLQLDDVNAAAAEAGMAIGLYADMAIGADPTGAEAWGNQDLLVRGASFGAPPDALNLVGQDWGMPPPDPVAMARTGFTSFTSLLDANMRRAGALRLDHVLALMRLYWIPAGAPATRGAYVRYPWRTLMARLAEASRRHRCLVVGEDLGTVPEGLRDALRESGVLAYRLLYFQQYAGRFLAPHEYPAEALVATGTHDLPPLPMWWHGEDIELRTQLELWPDAQTREAAWAERTHARTAIVEALQQAGVATRDHVPDAAPVEAIYAFLARTPCKLLMVQLEDVLDVHTQVNVPGTTSEHPNWRARLPDTLDEALAHPTMQHVARALNDSGRGGFDDRHT